MREIQLRDTENQYIRMIELVEVPRVGEKIYLEQGRVSVVEVLWCPQHMRVIGGPNDVDAIVTVRVGGA